MNQSSPKPTRQFRGKLTRTSLLLLLPLTLIPIAILGIVTLYNTGNFLREQIIIQFNNVANQQSKQIDELIINKSILISQITEDPSIRYYFDNNLFADVESSAWRITRSEILQNYHHISDENTTTRFDDFIVVLPDQTILIATDPTWEGAVLDQRHYQNLLERAQSVLLYNIYPFYTETTTNRLLLFTSEQISDPSGNILATLIGITDSPEFRRTLETGALAHPEGRAYFITNPFGEEVFVGISPNTNEIASFSPSLDHISTVIPKILSNDKEGVVEFNSFNDVPVLGFTKWIASANTALVLEVPDSVITGPLQNSAILQTILMVVALFVVGIVIWQGTRRIVKPITQVSQTAWDFADGNMRARAPVDRNDEIGMLAYSFNQVADQLVDLYRSLEQQVEDRTQQIQTAAEVAQISTSANNLDEMLSRVVRLIVERFGYYHAAIYILDRSGDHIILRQAAGQGAEEFLSKGLQIAVGSRSIVGNVAATNQAWVAFDVKQDPYYLPIAALPGTQSEAAVPLSVGERVLGVLDIQSNELNAFDEDEITTLQTLAGQIASALQNIRLLENTQIDLQATNLLYQASHQLADITSVEEAIENLSTILRQVPYTWASFKFENNQLKTVGVSPGFSSRARDLSITLRQNDIQKISKASDWGVIPTNDPPSDLLPDLTQLADQTGCEGFILMPFLAGKQFLGLLFIGSGEAELLRPANLEPYYSIAEIVNTSMEKVTALEGITQSYSELQSLNSISQAISTETELTTLFEILHQQIVQAMGEINFLIALYDSETKMIEIPYMTEDDHIITLPSFPLGQGLTSIVIRSQQPLMIVEDTVNRTRALGAIVTADKHALSWLGVPMIVAGEVVGAIVVQDTEKEHRFDDDDLRLLTTLAGQVAPIVRNTRLLAESQLAAERDRQLYEITDHIRQATSFQSILEITTRELSNVLNLKKAKIEIMVDPTKLDERSNGSEEKSE